MVDIGVVGAFLGGILSFVSPCVLPLVPPYLCYVGGVTLDQLAERDASADRLAAVFWPAVAFVLGFSTVFVALGATASLVGQLLVRHLGTLAIVGGVIIIVMGMHFLGVFRLALLYREARVEIRRKPPGLLGGYLLGLAFAFGWTPCIGPVLGAILFVAGSADTVAKGAFLLSVYALGLGVPFLLAAAFAPLFLGYAARFRRLLPAAEKAMGGFLVLTGVMVMTGQVSAVSFWMLETFPALGRIG